MEGETAREVVLECRGVAKSYRSGEDVLEVLRHIDFALTRGETVAIMGPSGVGKSTLLHILGTLDVPTTGCLTIAGTDILGMDEEELTHFRNEHIGFVFQFHHLLPEFTALENVMLPAMIAGGAVPQVEPAAAELLKRVGLGGRLQHRPGELSGGERQRVAMARALVRRPMVVLADEPSGNLDAGASENLHRLMGELASEFDQAFVVMTHDMALAQSMDRLGRLDDGRLSFHSGGEEA